MGQSKEIKIRDEVTKLVRGYALLMIAATTITVVGGLSVYWVLEDNYFKTSSTMSHIFALIFVGLIFHIVAHTSFIFYFQSKFQNPKKKPQWLVELDALTNKVFELEHQLAILKSRSSSSNPKSSEMSQLIVREQDFISEIESKIERINRKIKTNSSNSSITTIQETSYELEEILKLIERNREYLIIAA